MTRVGRFAHRIAVGRRPGASVIRPAVRMGAIASLMVFLGVGVVAAGSSAQGVIGLGSDDVLGRVPHQVDPATFPTITVEQGVLDWNHEIAGPGAQAIVLTLAENLELENQALLRGDASILEAVDHGDRLDAMQARLDEAAATGTTVIDRYAIDDVHVTLLVPFGQTGRSESRSRVPRDADHRDLRRGREPADADVDAVRHDLRAAPGDRRPLAQRRRTATGHRRLTAGISSPDLIAWRRGMRRARGRR